MKEIEFSGKTYTLATNWDEINIEQLKELNDLDLDITPSFSDYFKIFPVLTTPSMEKEILDTISFDSFKQIIPDLTFFFIKRDMIKEIIIDDVKYGFYDNPNKITAGEWATAEAVLQSDGQNKIEELVQIFLRQINEDGELDKFDTDKWLPIETIKEKVNAGIALAIVNFTLATALKSLNDSKNC